MPDLDRLRHIDLVNGEFAGTSEADLNDLFGAVATDHLVVHFHGGLVTARGALATAEALQDAFSREDTGAHPVFVIWHSGLVDILKNHFLQIAGDALFEELRDVVIGYAGGRIKQALTGGSRGLVTPVAPDALDAVEVAAGTDLTLTDEQEGQFEDLVENDAIVTALDGIGREGGPVPPAPVAELAANDTGDRAILSAAALAAIKKGALKVLKNTLARIAKGRGHGLHATVVEELLRVLYVASIGGAVWERMKGETATAFGADARRFGGTALLERLERWWRPGRRVTLVGHSTGAVYILNLLDAWHARRGGAADGRSFEVIFLAAACTARAMREAAPAFAAHVGRFRAFAMGDDRERADQLIGDGEGDLAALRLLYPHSLLYFVSGVVEEEVDAPLVGMARFFGDAPKYVDEDVRAVHALTRAYEAPFVWATDEAQGPVGAACDARDHGGIDGDPVTLASIRHLLRTWGSA